MAYLKSIEEWCDSMSCQARAKVELFDNRNQSYGKFCRRCGKWKLKDLQEREDQGEGK